MKLSTSKVKIFRQYMFNKKPDGTFESAIVTDDKISDYEKLGWRVEIAEWVSEIMVSECTECTESKKCGENDECEMKNHQATLDKAYAMKEISAISLNYNVLSKARLVKFGKEVFGINVTIDMKLRKVRHKIEKHLKASDVWNEPHPERYHPATQKEPQVDGNS